MSGTQSARPYKSRHTNKVVSDYTVIDIETTDCNVNDCELIEVAAARVRDDEIVDTYESLIKPPYPIPPLIEALTGITNQMVQSAPSSAQIIPTFAAFVGDDIVIGHNIVSFDSCVLYDNYLHILGIPFTNNIIDTLHFSRRCDISPDNYRLTTIAEYFGITYDAHRALNDCIANYKVYEALKPLVDEAALKQTSGSSSPHRHLSEKTLALARLAQMCRSFTNESRLSDDRILELIRWMDDNIYLAGNYPFDPIFEKISEISREGSVSEESKAELHSLLELHADPVKHKSENCDVDFTGKAVCLTGEFQYGPRDTVTELLKSKGVTVSGSVTSKTDYLIVGGEGSTAWSCGNYGSKVKKALELQEKGKTIKIIREDVLIKWLNSTS